MKINYIPILVLMASMSCVATSNLSEAPVPVYLGPPIATNGESLQSSMERKGGFKVNDAFSPLNIGPNRLDSRLTKVLKERTNEDTAAFQTKKVEVRSLVAMYFIYYYGTAYNLFFFEETKKP